jgi:ABC-2 type transport system permease protein
LALARYSLAREMAFRANFLARVAVEILWLGAMLIFYGTVFAKTSAIANWSALQYVFFVGCFFALGGVLETFFLGNCNEFAELVRSGDLDFYLLKPIDEQFLITCRDIDWATAPNMLLGTGVMVFALVGMGWEVDWVRVLLFLVMFGCGTAIAYSFLLILTSTSVYLVRNQSLYEMWWLVSTLMRYPRDIFAGTWAAALGWVFSFVIPVMVVIHVPASTMVKVLDPVVLAYTAGAAVVLLVVSRKFFRYSLKRYRSASS